jgi:hypothetical protein
MLLVLHALFVPTIWAALALGLRFVEARQKPKLAMIDQQLADRSNWVEQVEVWLHRQS